ncbi:MAG: response regulator, partial [Caldithrix sp.]|nr:response regulator [Caldithrix sp.]
TISSKSILLEKQLKKIEMEIKPGHYVMLEFKDNGSGMDENTKARIFEPFFSTKQKNKGTGLGLSMVYGFVRSHQGYIDVDSKLGLGTTFRIFLPVADTEQDVVEDQPRAIDYTKDNDETILVVDDEKNLREFLTNALQHHGYEVFEARDGYEAIDYFKSHKSKIDLVLLDMIMPNMDGKDTLKAIKKIDDNVKIIISTGYSDKDALETIKDYVEGIIYKPYRAEDILSTLRQVLG